MATPVAHALVGYTIGCLCAGRERRLAWPLLAACTAAAMAPDLDFLPGIFRGKPALYHQGWSHSLFVAAGVGTAGAWLLAPKGPGRARVGAAIFAAVASHLLLDLFGPDARTPYGIPLFWPLSEMTYLSPITLLPGVEHAESTSTGTLEWLRAVFAVPNLIAIGVEILCFAPVAGFATWLRWHRTQAVQAR